MSLRNALNTSALKGELQRIRHSREGRLTFADIITRSETMAAVLRTAQKAAASSIPVLVEGESGVGKELFARAIHGSSERKSKPFVAVNCGAIPDNLVESILFGHEKGAFTGATERHMGKFVEASGGTLFLDEVGELPLAAQVKLLRALQEGTVEAVGGRKPVKVDVRIISATNRKLLDLVKGGAIPRGPVLPAARAAADDPAVADAARGHPASVAAFPGALCRRGKPHHHRHQRRGRGPSRAARLARQHPPAREHGVSRRRHERERLCSACRISRRSSVTPYTNGELAHSEPLIVAPSTAPAMVSGSDIPIAPLAAAGSLSMLTATGEVRPLEDMENEIIRFAISHYRGQMSEVARRLKIGRSTLYRKLDEAAANDPAEGGAQEG